MIIKTALMRNEGKAVICLLKQPLAVLYLYPVYIGRQALPGLFLEHAAQIRAAQVDVAGKFVQSEFLFIVVLDIVCHLEHYVIVFYLRLVESGRDIAVKNA